MSRSRKFSSQKALGEKKFKLTHYPAIEVTGARLLGTLTPRLPEWIDGLANHCHDEYKLITCASWRRTGPATGDFTITDMTVPVTKLNFWGVRGSTPTVDPATWRYGGNTPCLELEAPDGTQFILDCGTGLRMLGNRWNAPSGEKSQGTHILITHYHWDHIQGVPFFAPLYLPNNEFKFYSFRSKFLGRDSLKQVFEAQMAVPYFPVDMSVMSAKRKFQEVEGGESFTIGENRISTRWLNHPQGCLGFRIETPAGTVAYATDNEPGDAKLDESLLELAAGADIFINDAQFTPEQLETTRKGWGHSSWREGVKAARHAGAKTLVLFHHDPDSTDRKVDSILRQARDEFDSVFAASEGMVITIGAPGEPAQAHMPGTRTALRREVQFHAKVCGLTEGGKEFMEETVVCDLSLQGAMITLKHLPQLQSQLQVMMDAPGTNGEQHIQLKGYVVRIDDTSEKGRVSVGVVFTD